MATGSSSNLKELVELVLDLKKSPVNRIVNKRISEFLQLNKKESREWFLELVFCILTANYSAEGGIRIQKELSECFIKCSEDDLAFNLKRLGHRFPRARAKYIVEARHIADKLKPTLVRIGDPFLMREWLVKNIKGIGYKEASHFLRNVGYFDLAILDYHILDILEKYNVIKRPKTLTRTKYLLIEQKMKEIAELTSLKVGILDLYLWYIETGKILK